MIQHVIVVVHGVGEQRLGETLSTFVATLGNEDGSPAFATIGSIRNAASECRPWSAAAGKANLPGFVEMYWADIARANRKRAPRSLIRWGTRLSQQIAALDTYRKEPNEKDPMPIERLSRSIEDTILTARLSRALLSHVRLDTDGLVSTAHSFMRGYDLFAEHPRVRRRILRRFHKTMLRLERWCEQPENGDKEVRIHLFAHSLGSVIAFMGLGELASSGHASAARLLQRTKTLCTVGSPLDLFLAIHPELFDLARFKASAAAGALGTKIRWINLVEHADPIASRCRLVSELLTASKPTVFDGDEVSDVVYARALVPGGAHSAYWHDSAVMRGYWTFIDGGAYPRIAFFIRRVGHKSSIVILCAAVLAAAGAAFASIFWAEEYGLFPSTKAAVSATGGDSSGLPTVLCHLFVVWCCIASQILLGSTYRVVRPHSRLVFHTFLFTGAHAVLIWVAYPAESRWMMAWTLSGVSAAISTIQLLADVRVFGWSRSASVVMGVAVILVCNALGVALGKPDDRHIMASVVHGVIASTIAGLLWWFATLWWRLFEVWRRFVVGRSHIDYLKQRWRNSIRSLVNAR